MPRLCPLCIQSPGQRSPLNIRDSAKDHRPGSGGDTPETLTGAGGRAGALLPAVPDRFKDSPEESLRGQGPGCLGRCLLKDIRKLRAGKKRKEEEHIIIKVH